MFAILLFFFLQGRNHDIRSKLDFSISDIISSIVPSFHAKRAYKHYSLLFLFTSSDIKMLVKDLIAFGELHFSFLENWVWFRQAHFCNTKNYFQITCFLTNV